MQKTNRIRIMEMDKDTIEKTIKSIEEEIRVVESSYVGSNKERVLGILRRELTKYKEMLMQHTT
ncbi:hypothetical protein ABEV55_08455 [Aneurinibacillus thermoaerophilus]|uniref:hypothetical protein n=1 Tax=Aneurinibacillus thermoaerophilus TaxID=143495 RepID=UPI002E1D8948|nr:hypothetical protein [Aneurinibacillus thermoaerophilus]